MQPLVSVITPAYNCSKFISETIKSVVNQTYTNWEMLIVDDCSTDNTCAVIEEWQRKDPRIILFRQDVNGGASLARNRAIEEAKGKYIAFLDGDDMWLPEKLEKQVAFMEANNYAMSYTPYYVIEGKNINEKRIRKAPCKVTYKDMLRVNSIGCLTVMVNIEKTGKVTIPRIDKRNDYALWLVIMRKGFDAYCLDESLSLYRSHLGISGGNKIKLLKYHYQLFNNILKYKKLLSAYYTIRNGVYYVFIRNY